MGNRTDPKKWPARERLLQVELLAFWRGWVRRQDLTTKFGISTPQASADLAAYNRINPVALNYDSSMKRYFGTPGMRPVLSKGNFNEALSVISEVQGEQVEGVIRIDLPLRTEPTAIVRQLVAAKLAHDAVEIRYYSINSGTVDWRWISPSAFAHDGYRWHVRAWCHRDNAYKDFVFGRIERIRAIKPAGKRPADHEWLQHVTVRFRARTSLSKVQRQAVERDFAMENGVGQIRVRRAMLLYTLAYLGLSQSTHPCSPLLESTDA